MGDSTTKLRLLVNASQPQFHKHFTKEKYGGDHQLENIVFSVGLNDLRDGTSVDQVVDDMKCLIEETQNKYTNSQVFICSILPVT